ncbi:flagellar biosynthesis protein FlhA [Iodobacter fluviatilis]|uniref:Flagellar biosynthesis protein FlhA n=1 Tax=Iodobacter fluviatilis TaxID=537 RepID=A0A377SW63_9NEIS|nr:flagellar biosynthesis protein FlhA [Iodobacter fluviatilis]TCU88087.1 flagellar biosynthesis protein FlhA [Iodobacter fluviatilis]STR45588.1 Flagellar biosynthesis protein flhA [Iodobacter fluviatilis]
MWRTFNYSKLAGPALVLMVLGMMVLPLPALVLDFFFTFNIAISIIVLMVALYTRKPLEFSSFPTILLFTTLLRLSLNVASTKLVLTEGHNGADAAGKVIEAFGHVLIGDNLTVGVVGFIILTIINFVVITKGAGRIAEVSARFTLDAMPGKQMAIDADLNAGMIGEEEARRRRSEISQEANFFGSMDGASKFVRGDAVAGIMVMVINIIGGLIVGMAQHDLPFAEAGKTYTLLTIGDGLVAQIPSLIISVAAGIVVSRVGDGEDLSEQILGQMFSQPQVMYVTSGVLGVLGIIPGMPHTAFLLMASILGGIAWQLDQRNKTSALQTAAAERGAAGGPAAAGGAPAAAAPLQEVSWNDVQPVDPVGLEVGYRLIPLVDRNQDGELLRRIRGIRKKIAQELGFLVPSVHIRDNLELKPNQYRIQLKGVDVGTGEAFASQWLAINPGNAIGQLPGTPTQDPTFGLPAVWIDANLRDQAQAFGYTVVDASTVVATHISNILQSHSAELLGREEVQQLLEHFGKEAPKLLEDLVPKIIPVGTLQKVLQNLLEEGMHIRDMRSILETLAEHITRTQNIDELTAAVRVALGRAIVHQLFPGENELQVVTLEPQLENILLSAVSGNSQGGLEPGLAERVLKQASELSEQLEQQGLSTVLIAPAQLRPMLSRFLRRSIPGLRVIAHTEIPDSKTIRIVGMLGAN